MFIGLLQGALVHRLPTLFDFPWKNVKVRQAGVLVQRQLFSRAAEVGRARVAVQVQDTSHAHSNVNMATADSQVQDHEIGMHEAIGDLAGSSLCLLLFQRIDQLDRREEANLSVMMLDGLDAESGRYTGFACWPPTSTMLLASSTALIATIEVSDPAAGSSARVVHPTRLRLVDIHLEFMTAAAR